jgi:hypothetical protein
MTDTTKDVLCAHCGSPDVFRTVPQNWSIDAQTWLNTNDYENYRCNDCGWTEVTAADEAESAIILGQRHDAIVAGYDPETDQSLQEFIGLQAFRSTHKTVTEAELLADDHRPVDPEHYPCGIVHRYDMRFPDDTTQGFYIVEVPGSGFHYIFMHPGDEVAPTLEEAEALLYVFILENAALR